MENDNGEVLVQLKPLRLPDRLEVSQRDVRDGDGLDRRRRSVQAQCSVRNRRGGGSEQMEKAEPEEAKTSGEAEAAAHGRGGRAP